MNQNKINQLFNELILDKFLMNFIPGLILYFCLHSFVPFTTGNWLTSSLILVTITWFLGFLVEFLVFRKAFLKRIEGKEFNLKDSFVLLIGKVGVVTLLAIVYSFCHFYYTDTPRVTDEEYERFYNLLVYSVFFGLLSGYFIFYYLKSIKNTKSDQ